MQDKEGMHIKYKQSYTKFRAISCFLMSCFCNMTQKEICKFVGNITQVRVSELSTIGMNIALKEKQLLAGYLKV